jgi:hypothetical protein
MNNKTINFSNGNLLIDSESVSFQQKRGFANNVNTISRSNIGNIEIQNIRILEQVETVYCFRTALIGIIVAIVGLIILAISKILFVFYLGCGIILFSVFLLFSWLLIDGLLGINFVNNILLSFYGVDVVRIVVQNKQGGNNLLFFVSLNEKSKLPKFEELKTEKRETVVATPTNYFGDIIQLGELLKSGLITQDEFERKKNQILGF